MPTEINGYSPSEETALSSLIINEVDSNETFKKMKEKGILQDNQLYLVTDEQGSDTYYTAGEVDALLQNKADTSSVYTKSETNTILQKKSNPNLLDNWYFGNPVNQRGQTTYTTHSAGDQYTIDRWLFGANNTITLQDGYISVGIPYSMIQYIELDLWKSFSGRTLTFSLLYKDGTLLEHAFKVNSDYTNVWINKQFDNNRGTLLFEWHDGHPRLVFYNSQYGDIVAVKIEFGDHQTLSHQDANGNWVLNEIPNYAQELAKCQRYYYQITAESNTKYAYFASGNYYSLGVGILLVPLKVRMRTTPVLSFSSLNDFLVMSNGGYALTKLALEDLGTDVVRLLVETNGGPAGQGATMRFGGAVGAYIGFSADL